MYKILTPDFRNQIIESLDTQARELNTCDDTPFVRMQKVRLSAIKNLILNLPDGYPIPLER